MTEIEHPVVTRCDPKGSPRLSPKKLERQLNAGRFFLFGGAGISSIRPFTDRPMASATSEPSSRLVGCTRCALPARSPWLPCSAERKRGFQATRILFGRWLRTRRTASLRVDEHGTGRKGGAWVLSPLLQYDPGHPARSRYDSWRSEGENRQPPRLAVGKNFLVA